MYQPGIHPEEIRRVEWVSMPCFHGVRVRLEDCAWSDAPCGPAPVPSTPLVDEMGQYIPKDWPGKTRDPESLNTFLHSQARLPDAYPTPPGTAGAAVPGGSWPRERATLRA